VKKYRSIFWCWIAFSFFFAIYICLNNLPIRDHYFPSIQDYIGSTFFLSGEAIILSSMTCILNIFIKTKKFKVALVSILTIILVLIFGYLFRDLLPLLLLIAVPFLIMITIGQIHFVLTYFIGEK
jgi:O-antigen/teichoic acid export membrane protein